MESTNIPGFGSYLLALFLTPIYCLTRGKYLGFVLSTILYVLAFLTFMVFGLGIIFWAVAAIPAAFSLRNEIIEAHASRTGEETAKALKAAGIGSANQTSQAVNETKLRPPTANVSREPPRLDQNDQKTCPMCAEAVKAAAVICKHCGHKFCDPLLEADASSSASLESSDVVASSAITLPHSGLPAEAFDKSLKKDTKKAGDSFCSQCGTSVVVGSLFCYECGQRVCPEV